MKRLLLLFLLLPTLTLNAQLLYESDKQMHFAAGTVFGGIAYGIVLQESEDKTLAMAASILTAFAAGYVKETYDKRRGYTFDNRDLLATSYGGLSIGITLDIFARDGKKRKRVISFKRE